jgi:hypothetical protein
VSVASGKSIRALIDTLVEIPASEFGHGRARILRKFVLVAIAKHANADGSNAMPSTATLARICLVTDRAIRQTVEWLKEHGLLYIEYKAGRHGCNRYTIRFPDAKPETPGTSIPGHAPGTDVPGTPGTIHARPGTTVPLDPEIENASLPSSYRPINREREETGQAALSPKDADKAKVKSAEDCRWIAIQLAANSWPATPQTKQIVRHYLNDGHSREMIVNAIRAAMNSKPGKERQPGLYLAQNLEGHINLLIAESRGEITARRNEPPGRAPDYLKLPERGPLTGEELEEVERETAGLRQQLGIPARTDGTPLLKGIPWQEKYVPPAEMFEDREPPTRQRRRRRADGTYEGEFPRLPVSDR